MRDAAFERDKAAVRFTRNPTALLHALEAIRADPHEVQRVSAATAPLWFEVPARVGGCPHDPRRANRGAEDPGRPGSLGIRLTTYEPDLDMGVRGFDFVSGIGGSEPTSPDRREKSRHNQQLPTLKTKWHSLPKHQPRPSGPCRSGRDRASSRTAHRRDWPRGPSGHHSEAGVAACRR